MPNSPTTGAPDAGEVFISYTWDDDQHVKRILELSNRLRSDGIDCVLDQYEVSPPEGWPKWMDRKIRDAEFVLTICTETYYKRVMGEEEEGRGIGAQWESNLIYQHLYNAGAANSKFIPVLLHRNDRAFIPTPLQGATYYLLDSENGYYDLYKRLLKIPKAEKPPLGKRRSLPPKPVKTDPTAYLMSPINVELWDQARWKSVFFLWAEDSIPVLGLGFLYGDPAKKIFESWHERYGERDEFEELRISIVEGDIPGEHPGYSVHIGADIGNTIKRYEHAGLKVDKDESFLIGISRIHRMNPVPGSQNLEMFKKLYRRFKTYLLVPGTMNADGTNLQPMFDLAIYKNAIHFRRFEDIVKGDEDSIFLEPRPK